MFEVNFSQLKSYLVEVNFADLCTSCSDLIASPAHPSSTSFQNHRGGPKVLPSKFQQKTRLFKTNSLVEVLILHNECSFQTKAAMCMSLHVMFKHIQGILLCYGDCSVGAASSFNIRCEQD